MRFSARFLKSQVSKKRVDLALQRVQTDRPRTRHYWETPILHNTVPCSYAMCRYCTCRHLRTPEGHHFTFHISLRSVLPTDRPEAFVQVPGVQQRPRLPGLVQGGPHDLAPQGGVQADDLWDVAEQLGGLHLGEQAALLQVQQPALEQLQGGEGEKKKKNTW